jgi:DNA-binding CsgD family transcriptional regulator
MKHFSKKLWFSAILLITCFFLPAQDTIPETIDDYLKIISQKYGVNTANPAECIQTMEKIALKNPAQNSIKLDLAILHSIKEEYFKAIQYLNQYMDTETYSSDSTHLCITQRLLAANYGRLSYYEKAKKMHLQCIKYHLSKKQYGLAAVNLNNIGGIFIEESRYDSALTFLYEALKTDSLTQNHKARNLISVNLVNVYGKLKRYEQSYKIFRNAIQYTNISSVPRLHYIAMIQVIPSLMHFQQYDTAIKYFHEAENYLFSAEIYEPIVDSYKAIVNYYINKKIYDSAFKYQQRWAVCLQKVYQESDNIKIQKQELDKMEKEKIQIAHQLSLQKIKTSRRNLVIVLLITSIALIVSISINYYRKLNLKRIQETQLLQKKLLIELQNNQTLMQQQINHLQENEKLKDYINSQLEQEVQKRTEEVLQKEKEILSLKEAQIKTEKEKIEKEALTQALVLQQKNEVFEEIKNSIETFRKKNLSPEQAKQLHDILMLVKKNLNLEHQWDSFKTFFEANYPAFMQEIIEKHPQLTQNDIRHIAYIRMGLSTKEIATLMGIEPSSVLKSRYRIKQKLNPESDKTLYELLNEI